jgi:hypothetical protein
MPINLPRRLPPAEPSPFTWALFAVTLIAVCFVSGYYLWGEMTFG